MQPSSVVEQCIEMCGSFPHVMVYTSIRAIESFFALLRKALSLIIDYHEHSSISDETISNYMSNYVLLALCWGLGGSISLKERDLFARQVGRLAL